MRLISCHIENFGKLSDVSLNFEEGINTICEENGWGKSTLAAFIKSMLYGLEKTTKQSIFENDRKRYSPWQKGIYGGQLAFEINGKQYVVNRVFAEKNKGAVDEFELRDLKTNLVSNDYSENLGEEIFKINRESFMRTIFIEQSGCETGSTADINAKIGNLVDDSSDINNFDSATESLKKILNALTPSRLTGSIRKRIDEIATYERKVSDKSSIEASIRQYQELLKEQEEIFERKKTERSDVSERQKEVAVLQTAKGKKSEWDRLIKEVKEKQEKVSALQSKFPGDIPDLDEIKEKIDSVRILEQLANRMETFALSENDSALLSKLKMSFMNGVPSEDTLNAKLSISHEILKIRHEMNSENMSLSEKERLSELAMFYSNDTDEVSEMAAKWSARTSINAALPPTKATLATLRATLVNNQPKRGKISVPFLIIGIICLIAGIIITSKMPFAGVALIVVGGALSTFSFFKNKPEPIQSTPEIDALQNKIDMDEQNINNIDSEISSFLYKHGRSFDENTVPINLQKIMEEKYEYNELLKKKSRVTENQKSAIRLQKLIADEQSFLAEYGINLDEERIGDQLHELKAKVANYTSLAVQKRRYTETQKEYELLQKELVAYLYKFKYENIDDISLLFDEIKDNITSYYAARDLLEDDIDDLKQFEANNDLTELDLKKLSEDIPSLESLNEEIQNLTDSMDRIKELIDIYNKNLEECQTSLDEIAEDEETLNVLKAVQEEEYNKYKYVTLAQSKLIEAKETLTAKYSAPLLISFKKYFESITGLPADNYNIDANSVVTINECGKQRNVEALSSGYRDLIGICMRLALIDAMYQDEKPIIVMDDPFTNLDDKKIVLGKTFLNEVSKSYQIIYLTCSGARK